jgi:hypothetical protein
MQTSTSRLRSSSLPCHAPPSSIVGRWRQEGVMLRREGHLAAFGSPNPPPPTAPTEFIQERLRHRL